MRAGLAVVVSALGVLCTPVGQAAAQDSNALEVIAGLESQGYTVHIDRIGSAPVKDCIVTDVRNPQQVVQNNVVIGGTRSGGVIIGSEAVVIRQPISVSLDCRG
ncbi:hypothetical protein [Mycobacterium sp. 236(2023)]|uniref:hypothetical protein n=1 Tax=Mycobacterium sp. 236(2023) TaxID=3038163 RepID=UPI002415395F|nr:hypothetical protein [Mycobacterium sp. 236(2023)]MDG4665989.1 hypothetical protein [Mycobacterium sp. 236(2023)]